MPPTAGPRPANDALMNIALGGLVAVVAFGGVLGLAGSIAAFLTGHPQPTAGITDGLGVLAAPADPGTVLGTPDLNPFAYWAVVVLLLGILATATLFVYRAIRAARSTTNPNHLAGTASGTEIARVASPRALVKRASTLRPSVTGKPEPGDVGYLLGTSKTATAPRSSSVSAQGPEHTVRVHT